MDKSIGMLPLSRRTLLASAGGLALTAGLPQSGGARPPQLKGGAPFRALPEEQASKGELKTIINAGYGYYDLAGQPVALRTYNGGPAGATLRLRAGDTLKLSLVNTLPANCGDCPPTKPAASSAAHAGHMVSSRGQEPRSFNITNMHVHGVHVSPEAPSDNILIPVNPGQSYDYEYQIPKDHPAGTYFYHAHIHGSVALQVSSGMAGALIIEGPLDDIPEIEAAEERVLIFQSQCIDQDGRCETFPTLNTRQPTYINGQYQPVLSLQPGEVQHWRLINATHDRFLLLRLTGLNVVALAWDGNPQAMAEAIDVIPLSPGNRADVLVQANDTGTFKMTTDSWPAWDYPTAGTELASITVTGTSQKMALYTGPLGLENYPSLTPLTPDQATMGRRITVGEIGSQPVYTFTIDDHPFPENGTLEVALNSIELWEVVNQTSDPHPFHIHVNPMQVVDGGGLTPAGRWLDTVVLPPARKIRFLTRFADFTGTFVFHCHILTHEDLGMMRLMKVVA